MKKAGRPLSFDRQIALEKAMLTFWKSGYETTSITDLTLAMGITAPSLYTAFGDKQKLFIEAVNLYAFGRGDGENFMDKADTAFDAAKLLLSASINIYTDPKTPAGCLMASSTATGSDNSIEVRHYVTSIRANMRDTLKVKIQKDIDEGQITSSTNALALANFIFAVIQGMSVLARDGLSRAELESLSDIALSSWP